MRWGIAALVVVSAARLGWGSCIPSEDFGQLAMSCGGGTRYCYVTTTGLGTTASLTGAFWTFGVGDPQIGTGNDNGSLAVDNWLITDGSAGSNRYLFGTWTEPAIDGCPRGWVMPGKPAEIMVVSLGDAGGTASIGGLFAVAAAVRVPENFTEFDFTFAADGGVSSDIALAPLPRARVAQSTRTSIEFVAPTLDSLVAGIYTDGAATPDELVAGYRVYRHAGNALTTYRRGSDWTATTGTLPLGQNAVVPLPTSDTFYAYAIVFDSGFESDYVGQAIQVHLQCQDWDGDGYSSNPECCPDWAFCDCDDNNALVHPGALEVCDGLDNNCDGVVDNVALPGASAVRVDKQNGASHVFWWDPATVATSYDAVTGDLNTLRASGGSFAASTFSCLANDTTAAGVDDPVDPYPDQGFWYLVRAANCTGKGSYDDAESSLAAPRDPGIAASGHACP